MTVRFVARRCRPRTLLRPWPLDTFTRLGGTGGRECSIHRTVHSHLQGVSPGVPDSVGQSLLDA